MIARWRMHRRGRGEHEEEDEGEGGTEQKRK